LSNYFDHFFARLFGVFHGAPTIIAIITRRKASVAEYWKRFMARLNGVHAFGYNSAGSEPIWMKFGALSTLFAAGHGRFWARSAQKRERESESNLFVT